ncbi:MAG: putative nucleic acid-binding protein [Spirosomataceae bacterium]|jgi:predicted nucleic acid-binding protein
MNLIIGVTALASKLILVTDNVKDFRFIDGLEVENRMNSSKS